MAEKQRGAQWEGYLPRGSIVMARKRAPSAKKIDSQTDTAPGDSLEKIAADLHGCMRCKLCKGRTNVVVGEGSPRAELVFVGEGPGENEDLQGRPFVGRAGQLLDKMIEAIGLSREQVHILNVVKCRPPENRNPEPDEIAACSPFLYRQLDVLKPKVVVALGKFAAQTLLATETRISELRGKFHPYRGAKLMPTWHPAYLLRNPPSKREAWDDLKAVARELGLEVRK
jgi:DNA polymerase